MFSQTEIYSPYDKRMQREERDRFMRWQRSDWLQSVEDVIFQHTMLGVSAIHFSGDHRPEHEHRPGYPCVVGGYVRPRAFWMAPEDRHLSYGEEVRRCNAGTVLTGPDPSTPVPCSEECDWCGENMPSAEPTEPALPDE